MATEALRPDPIVVRPTIPSECRVDPVEPQPLAQPELPPLPAPPAATATPAQAFPYYVIRTQRAEIAGLYFQNELSEVREAFDANAATQRACATWARGQ